MAFGLLEMDRKRKTPASTSRLWFRTFRMLVLRGIGICGFDMVKVFRVWIGVVLRGIA
jgi:hypothetical protein